MTTVAPEMAFYNIFVEPAAGDHWLGEAFRVISKVALPTTPEDLSWLVRRLLQEAELGQDDENEALKERLLTLRDEYVTRLRRRALALPISEQESAEDWVAYLKGQDDYQPPPVLRMMARRFPWIDWLCYLPPKDRAWHVAGPNADYHREMMNIPLAAWQALRAEVVDDDA